MFFVLSMSKKSILLLSVSRSIYPLPRISLSLSISLSQCLRFLSICPFSVCSVCVSLTLPPSAYLFRPLSVSLYSSIRLSFSLTYPLSLFLSIIVCMSLSLNQSFFFSLSLSLFLLPVSVCVSILSPFMSSSLWLSVSDHCCLIILPFTVPSAGDPK